MNVDRVMLKRFRCESVGMLPADLLRWVLAALSSGLSAPERIEARDELLREAGELVGGSTWNRMVRIRALILSGATGDAVADLVSEAIAFTPGRVPESKRQLLRILGSDVAGPRCHE